MAVRLAVIGAGRRVQAFYMGILDELVRRGAVEVVGVYSRSRDGAEAAAGRLGAPAVGDFAELLALRPAAVLVAVPPQPKDGLAVRLLDAGLHVFLETPAATNATRIRHIAALASRKQLIVEIAEDHAFQPEALLHRQILDDGVMGRILTVFNDGKEYYYHACARLHATVDRLPPVTNYRGHNAGLGDGARVELREVEFRSGFRYFHRYASPKSHPVRARPAWTIVCEHGTLTDEDAVWGGADDRGQRNAFVVEGPAPGPGPAGQVTSLSVRIADREFRWAAPFGPPEWTRQHRGLAHLLERFLRSVEGHGTLHYGLRRAVVDVELWQGMEFAARMPIGRVPAWLARCEDWLRG